MALYAMPLNHPRSSRALNTARRCLRVNRENCKAHMSRNNIYAWAVYCHWVLLDAPLTPFTGVFCNVIANPESSSEDLQLLKDFAASLQPAVALSEAIEKFHQLCSIFVSVAQAYVRAKVLDNGKDHTFSETWQPIMGEFDELSATLGLFGSDFTQDVNMSNVPAVGAQDGSTPRNFEPMSQPSLLDWQSGNVSLYGLLEQDLSDITGVGGSRPGT